MFSSTRPLDVLRSVVCLTLIGVAVITLSGPALAVAGVLLPFVLVGGLTWGGYRVARMLVRRVRAGRTRIDVQEPVATPSPVPVLFRQTKEERPAPRRRGRFGSMMRTAMHVGVEVACGAALGAALSILVDWQIGSGIQHPAVGAAIGAVVGFIVGGSRSQSAAERAGESEAASSQAA